MFFSLVTLYFIFKDDGSKFDFVVLLLNYLISQICLVILFKYSKYPFSLNNIIHLFFLFFFGLAPALQFKQNIVFWGSINYLTPSDYIVGNCTLLIVLLLYNLGYSFFKRKNLLDVNKTNQQKISKLPFKNEVNKSILLIISVSSFLLFAYSKSFDLLAILLRGGYLEVEETNPITNNSIALIINIFIRPMPLICLYIYKVFDKNKKIKFFEICLIALTLFSNAPTGMARFLAAALYIPILLVYFKPLSKKLNFTILFCFGLLTVFPFLNQFRYIDQIDGEFGLNTEMFTSEGFDCYQNTINVIKHESITNGNQLAGVILFFVPRSFWPTKPIGSGAYFAEEKNYDFSNISMSFFGEGYINAGFIGVFIFTVFMIYKAYRNSMQVSSILLIKKLCT